MRFATLSFGFTLLVLVSLVFAVPAFAGHGHKAERKDAILVVAFGTSIPEARASYKNIEKQIRKAFPKNDVRWAYTSNIIRRKVLKEEGIKLLSVPEALASLQADGYTHVAVQSLHTIPGEEFHEKVLSVAHSFSGMHGGIEHLSIGWPMLSTDEDMRRCAATIAKNLPAGFKKGDALVLMGHGTHHPANIYYPGLQWYLSDATSNILVGTVEGTPSLDDVKAGLKAMGAKTVWLMPLMSVAGDHARNDMAGDEDDSWKSELSKAGYTVKYVLKGTAEYDDFAAIWVDHLRVAVKHLQ